MAILFLRRRQIAHLPAGRGFDSDVIVLFKRKFKIDRVDAIGMIKYSLLGGAGTRQYKCADAGSRKKPDSGYRLCNLGAFFAVFCLGGMEGVKTVQ